MCYNGLVGGHGNQDAGLSNGSNKGGTMNQNNIHRRSNAAGFPIRFVGDMPKRVSVTLCISEYEIIADRARCRGIPVKDYMNIILTDRLGKPDQTAPFKGKWYHDAFTELEDRNLEPTIEVIVGLLKAGYEVTAINLILSYLGWPESFAEAEQAILGRIAQEEDYMQHLNEILKDRNDRIKKTSFLKRPHDQLHTVVSKLAIFRLDETRLNADSTVAECLLEILRVAPGPAQSAAQ
jgi:hypothetical protein